MSTDALSALRHGLRVRLAALMASANIGNIRALIEIETAHSRDWASATFSGAQHRLSLRLEGDRAHAIADLFLTGMEEAEFDLGRHILVDIALAADERRDGGDWVRLTLDALTVAAD